MGVKGRGMCLVNDRPSAIETWRWAGRGSVGGVGVEGRAGMKKLGGGGEEGSENGERELEGN